MLTSARNVLHGRVTRMTGGAVNDEVELELRGGEKLVAVITRASAEALRLKIGVDAVALIKASSVLVGIDDGTQLQLSARNILPGRIAQVTPGAVNTEVAIELRGGALITAVITNVAAQSLGLEKGKSASAIFKASSVILGVS